MLPRVASAMRFFLALFSQAAFFPPPFDATRCVLAERFDATLCSHARCSLCHVGCCLVSREASLVFSPTVLVLSLRSGKRFDGGGSQGRPYNIRCPSEVDCGGSTAPLANFLPFVHVFFLESFP